MMVTKGVTFNQNKEDQVKLFNFAMEQDNFSGYVKKLIEQDMEAKKRRPQVIKQASGGIKFSL